MRLANLEGDIPFGLLRASSQGLTMYDLGSIFELEEFTKAVS